MPLSYPVVYRQSATRRGFQSTARAPLRATSVASARTPLQALYSSAWFRALPEGLAATLGLFGDRLMELLTIDLPKEGADATPPQSNEIPDSQVEKTPTPAPGDLLEEMPQIGRSTQLLQGWSIASECSIPNSGTNPFQIPPQLAGKPLRGYIPNTPIGCQATTYNLAGIPVYANPRKDFTQCVEYRVEPQFVGDRAWSYRSYTNANPIPGNFEQVPLYSQVPVIPYEFPLENPLEIPFSTPWELPIKQPGIIANPRPVVRPGVRPQEVPARQPLQRPAQVLEPVVRPGTITIIQPGLKPVVRPLTKQNPRPPTKGEREGKPRGRTQAAALRFIANVVSEFRDLVEALWKAIPESFRSEGKPTLTKMIEQLGDYLLQSNGIQSDAYWKEALIQLITSEIKDQFFGRAGKFNAKASAEFFGDHKGVVVPRGFDTGGSYRPKVPKEFSTNYLEDAVRRVVNAVWP